MPFITQERRDAIANDTLITWQPGDLCYVEYRIMVAIWKANPSWTTAHKIYRTVLKTFSDKGIAQELAWQVFFQLYVMPYELKKREENGDI